MKPPFRVRVGCYDCTGEDFQGCFDGGFEYVMAYKLNPSETAPAEFLTIEAARIAMSEAVAKFDGAPWFAEIVDAEDKVVKS